MKTLSRWLTTIGALVATSILILGVFVLLSARQDAWTQARRNLENVSVTLVREISRNIAVYDLSLQGVQKALSLPGLNDVSPEIREAALFDQSASAEYLGSLLVLNRNGMVVGDSTSLTPHVLSLVDRDYFVVHHDKPDIGLYLSQPFRSRLRGGDPSISISRRVDTADGQFNGVVVGTMRLAYFNSLFEHLNLGEGGAIVLSHTDGRVIARLPQREADFERILGPTSQTQQFLRTGQRELIGTSAIDGLERLIVFSRIPGLPLVLSIGVSTASVMAPWWQRSIPIGLALTVLSAAVSVLCYLFSKELHSRMRAEANALKFAEQVSLLATTDALTGLANRRAFNEKLDMEWRRSTRNRTSLACLMIDADQFKLYNDRYGHLEGDRVLQIIADCMLQRTRRPADVCARFGGEEFVVLLPETELEGAMVCAEAIRANVVAHAITHADSFLGFVSVSIGVTAIYPYADEPSADLAKRADEALYEAKRAGRNRVMTSQPEQASFLRQVTHVEQPRNKRSMS